MRSFFLVFLSLIIASCQSPSPAKATIKPITVHGHRGTRGTRPENTMPAFKEALNLGLDVLELDLHLTRDGILVISHDPEVRGKLCRDSKGVPLTKPISIRTLTAKELSRLDCGSVKHPDFPEQVLVPHTPIPTLEELLVWISKRSQKVQLNIETKMDEETAALNPDPKVFVEKILQLLKKYGVVRQSILQSFDYRTLDEARKLEPTLRIATLVRSGNICSPAVEHSAPITSPDFHLLTSNDVKNCQEKGIEVVPWTANTEADWKSLIEFGVDGIITDYPGKLLQYLKENIRHEDF